MRTLLLVGAAVLALTTTARAAPTPAEISAYKYWFSQYDANHLERANVPSEAEFKACVAANKGTDIDCFEEPGPNGRMIKIAYDIADRDYPTVSKAVGDCANHASNNAQGYSVYLDPSWRHYCFTGALRENEIVGHSILEPD